MKHSVFLAVGWALLSVGGIGIIAGLAWLTASRVTGNLPYVFDARDETLLYLLPALLLFISIVGAVFVASALASPGKEESPGRHLRLHSHFR
jgi:hypothetical protein